MGVEADEELLARWTAGDAAAGRALVERHLPAIHRFFFAKAADQAEDLIQATFLACVESHARFDGRGSFRAYLFGIARHILYRHYRTKRRRPDLDFQVTSLADLGPGPVSLVAADESRRVIEASLAALPLDHQIVLELYYWEGMRVAEVAGVMECAEGTIKSRLARARAGLEAELARRGASSLLDGLDRAGGVARARELP